MAFCFPPKDGLACSFLATLIAFNQVGCEPRAAARRSNLEQDLELGRVDEAGTAIREPGPYRPRRTPRREPQNWLESAGLPGATLTGTWSEFLDLGTAFPAPQALRLRDGSILVTGGRAQDPSQSGAFRFYPSTRGLASVPATINAPHGHHATLELEDGSVLFVKGNKALRYLPDEGRTEVLPHPPGHAAEEPRATLLPDGQVLLLNNYSNKNHQPCALVYDPRDKQWRITDPLPFVPARGTLTWLGEGRLLICGGWDASRGGNLAHAVVFDPGNGHFKGVSPMGTSRRNHTATLLPTGLVLVAGGYNDQKELDSTEIFDPSSRQFRPGPSLPFPMARHAARLLGSGELLLTSGSATVIVDGYSLKTRALRQPDPIIPGQSETAEPGGISMAWRENAALVLDSEGKPWLFGGTALQIGTHGLEGSSARTGAALH